MDTLSGFWYFRFFVQLFDVLSAGQACILYFVHSKEKMAQQS
jgi:hypothetical protein